MKIGYRIVIITALLVFISYFFLFEIEKRDNIIERAQNYILTSTDTKNNAFSVPKPEEDTFKQYTLKTSAWIPYWDEERGFKIFYDNIDKIDSVSPVWFYANSDGTLTQRKSTSSIKNYVDRVHDLGGEIIPTITNPSAQELSNIINNPALLDSHIANIVIKTEEFNFDGIDIDYENIIGTDKDAFSNFISKLSNSLNEKNKLLTIAVLPKTDNFIYQFSGTRQAQDWVAIGNNVDEFRIMGYDWTHNSTTEHGPISPVNWLEEIIEYALVNIPKEKIVLGLPLYGYYWKPGGVSALTWEQTGTLKTSGYYEWDESSKENHIILNGSHAWYHDARSVEERKLLAEKYDIKGVVFWRLGGEDPEIWK